MSRRSAIISTSLTAGVLLLAAGLRLWASWDDFWLDEIWSWALIQQAVTSWSDVLLNLRHENNHYLNTWWIYALGPDVDWRWYRLPAVILGVGVVDLQRRIAADFSIAAMWLVTILSVPSYLLVHYSSEARGYAYLMFFSLAAYVLLQRCLPPSPNSKLPARKPSTGWYWLSVVFFCLCCIAGCFGHPAFLLVFIALGVWAMVRICRVRWLWQQKLIVLVRLFAVPTICLGAFWLFNLSALQNSSGPRGDPWIVGVETLSLMVGGPADGAGALIVGGLVALAIVAELILLARERDDRCVAWFGMIAAPLALIVITGRKEVYPRYYLGAVVFLDVALADLAARCLACGRSGRVAVILVCIATAVGNSIHLARLYEYGRGHSWEVVRWIESHTQETDILIGSDFDFRHGLVLQYYSRFLQPEKRLVYVPLQRWPHGGPAWLLTHSVDAVWEPEPEIIEGAGNRYLRVRIFPYAGLSGWHTAVYHNANQKIESESK